MKFSLLASLFLLGLPIIGQAQLNATGATASWLGNLPPQPKADISPEQQAALEKELAEVTAAFQSVKEHVRAADVDIFIKAVRYAIEFHEWYDKTPESSIKKAQELLAEARKRIASLEENETPWMNGSGPKVLGFYSDIDDSPQPYGVEVPEGLEWGKTKKAIPMWMWLHGRGDTMTDLYFIYNQLKGKGGEFKPKDAIVVHPFGRFCNGFKSAGETDVFECRWDALKRFHVDPKRIALMGFSMGGAGAWHIGAHYADQWAVVHTGAGFVDVKRYQKLTPEKMPSATEQTLWHVYDVPDYARNFFNVPLISYSGEVDAQRDSAEYMTEVLAKEGFTLKHLIGPGMPHKYHPEVREEITGLVAQKIAKGRELVPQKVWLQNRSARYARKAWVEVIEVEKQWNDTRVEAELIGNDGLNVVTQNVVIFQIDPAATKLSDRKVTIDHQSVIASKSGLFVKENGVWKKAGKLEETPRKAGGTCIEDAFLHRFVVVLPDKPGRSPQVDAWVKAESEHFIQRWRRLMRGDPLVAKASEVGAERALTENLILFGDDQSNAAIAARAADLPVKWTGDSVTIGKEKFASATHVPVLISPDVPYNAKERFIVLNSGLTFREAHDRTNSLQNPKLPDWAILEVSQPPNAEQAGKIVADGFFDEHWKVQ